MTDQKQKLAAFALFEDLSPVELDAVGALTQTVEWQVGESVYALGDPGGSMFAVVQGAVELFSIVGGVERRFMTARAGQVFGLLSILDRGDRPGNARALERTEALVMDQAALDRLLAEMPEAGVKILRGLGQTLGHRVRLLSEQFEATMVWNLEVTGLASLNLERLMSERIEVSVETSRGEPLTGTLLRFETSAAGHELYIATPDRQIHVVPYHAIVRLSVDRARVEDHSDGSAQ